MQEKFSKLISYTEAKCQTSATNSKKIFQKQIGSLKNVLAVFGFIALSLSLSLFGSYKLNMYMTNGKVVNYKSLLPINFAS